MARKRVAQTQPPRPNAGAPLVLALDIGSSSVKAGLYDSAARAVGPIARGAHALRTTRMGASEADPLALASRVEAVIDTVLNGMPAGAEIAGVGTAVFASSLVGLNARGEPVTPVHTYADSRSAEDATALRRDLDAEAVHHRTGCPLHTSYLPSQILWLRRTRPDAFAGVRRWSDFATYLLGRWLGRADMPMSQCLASWTGLLDRHRLHWDAALLSHLGVSAAALPPLAGHADGQSGLAAPFRSRWPALVRARFFPAVGDGAAANVGSGCIGGDRLAVTVGTTGAVRALLPGSAPVIPQGLWEYRLDPYALLGGSFSAGGNVPRWISRVLRAPSLAGMDADLRAAKPDCHGLTVLPFLAGERSPGWALSATGAIVGMRQSTTAKDVAQAFVEAATYRFARVADRLGDHLDRDCEAVASGGGIARSPYWLQLMADVLRRPVHTIAEPEATSRGVAMLALHALGVLPDLTEAPPKVTSTYQPDPARGKVYRAALERQERLYAAIIDDRWNRS